MVLKAGAQITLPELRKHALEQGCNIKWLPMVMVLMPAIPKGPTGKPARIGLALSLIELFLSA